jgi:hypothetical protein
VIKLIELSKCISDSDEITLLDRWWTGCILLLSEGWCSQTENQACEGKK